MRKLIISCDRCGTEITGEPISILPKYSKVGSQVIPEGMNELPLWIERMQDKDFCRKCTEAIVNYALKRRELDEDNVQKKHQAEANKDYSDPERKGGKRPEVPMEENKESGRSKLDIGKIMALTKAGWPAAQIADEMGISTQAVYDARWRSKNTGTSGNVTEGK